MTEKEEAIDLEYPQLWENYCQLLAHRQRMLQSALAFYINPDSSIKALFDCESRLGLPYIEHEPKTEKGKAALAKFKDAIHSYTAILERFKHIYNF